MFVPHSCYEPFYAQTAFQIIQEQPQVISDRVGIVGLSFGASVALTVAAYSQISRVRIQCVCQHPHILYSITQSHRFYTFISSLVAVFVSVAVTPTR